MFQSTPIALVERDVSALKARLDALQASGVADVEAHLQRLSASFGVAACPDDALNMQTLLALADHALFRAKGMGRNSILAAGDAALPQKAARGAPD